MFRHVLCFCAALITGNVYADNNINTLKITQATAAAIPNCYITKSLVFATGKFVPALIAM